MKKTLLISGIIAIGSAFAGSTTVDCSNTFGLMPVSYNQKYTLVAVPFTDYEGGNIKINQLIKTSNLNAGDKIYVPNGENYDVWEIVVNSDGSKVWQAANKVEISDAGTAVSQVADSSEATLARGNAFWLYRESSTTDNFYLMGQDPTDTVVTKEVTASQTQMLANSQNEALVIKNLNGMEGDVLNVPGPTGSLQKYVYHGSSWCIVTVENFITKYTPVGDSETIQAGVGFFYRASSKEGTRSLAL